MARYTGSATEGNANAIAGAGTGDCSGIAGFGARMTGVALAVILAVAASAIRAAPATRVADCLTCHGPAGAKQTPPVPALGGQTAFFVLTQLFLFREQRRDSGPMIALARGMSDADMQALADAVAKLPPPDPPAATADSVRFERGRALAKQHRCGVCHSPDFSGQGQVPRLANQREGYLLKSLRDFKSGKRIGYGGAMADVLAGLEEADLTNLAHYLAHLR